MSHSYHPDSPNYSPNAVFQEGCTTCATRAGQRIEGLLELDPETFDRLWLRMIEHEFGGGLRDTNTVENMALGTCYRLYVVLERYFLLRASAKPSEALSNFLKAHSISENDE